MIDIRNFPHETFVSNINTCVFFRTTLETVSVTSKTLNPDTNVSLFMSPDKQADEAAIRKWHQEVEDAVNNADFEAYSSHWAEDMIWMPPNMPPMYGKDNCLGMAKYSFEHYEVEQKVTVEEIVISGDIAFSRIFSKEKFTPRGDEPAMENDGKNIFTFKRRPDGSWMGVHCIWNSNIPPDPSTRFDELHE